MSILDKIWVPKSAKPAYVCRICGDEFHAEESVAYGQHVAKCARGHHDEIVAAYERARPPGFYKPADPEYARWVREHGRVG